MPFLLVIPLSSSISSCVFYLYSSHCTFYIVQSTWSDMFFHVLARSVYLPTFTHQKYGERPSQHLLIFSDWVQSLPSLEAFSVILTPVVDSPAPVSPLRLSPIFNWDIVVAWLCLCICSPIGLQALWGQGSKLPIFVSELTGELSPQYLVGWLVGSKGDLGRPQPFKEGRLPMQVYPMQTSWTTKKVIMLLVRIRVRIVLSIPTVSSVFFL